MTQQVWKKEDFQTQWFSGKYGFCEENTFLMHIYSFNPESGLFIAKGEEERKHDIRTETGIEGIIKKDKIIFRKTTITESPLLNFEQIIRSMFKNMIFIGDIAIPSSGLINTVPQNISLTGTMYHQEGNYGLTLKAQFPYKP